MCSQCFSQKKKKTWHSKHSKFSWCHSLCLQTPLCWPVSGKPFWKPPPKMLSHRKCLYSLFKSNFLSFEHQWYFSCMYWVAQKVRSGFSVTAYRKTQTNRWANPILHSFLNSLFIYTFIPSSCSEVPWGQGLQRVIWVFSECLALCLVIWDHQILANLFIQILKRIK